MANLIIIRGQIDAGKTTTCGLIYDNLIPLCEPNHLFNGRNVSTPVSVRNSDGITRDFEAILTFQKITIGIISAGDVAEDVRPRLNDFIAQNVHTIICCTRSRNRDGSTFQMIENDFRPQHPIIHVQWIERIRGNNFLPIRMNDVNEVINVIRTIQQ